MNMKKIMMLMAAMLLTACSKDNEVMAEPVNASATEAGKTLVGRLAAAPPHPRP